jgi:hypothetical protein
MRSAVSDMKAMGPPGDVRAYSSISPMLIYGVVLFDGSATGANAIVSGALESVRTVQDLR